jgi:Asp-tRNA(Asn)/Glu-tRNA(Gln) amidotransferase C subunit
VSPELLEKLHTLSALIPPSKGTAEHARLTRELEEMIRLVEAVKLVDVSAVDAHDGEPVPDGRVWPDNVGMILSSNTRDVEYEPDDGETGRELLKHAARVKDEFYVVDTDRRRR